MSRISYSIAYQRLIKKCESFRSDYPFDWDYGDAALNILLLNDISDDDLSLKDTVPSELKSLLLLRPSTLTIEAFHRPVFALNLVRKVAELYDCLSLSVDILGNYCINCAGVIRVARQHSQGPRRNARPSSREEVAAR